MIFRAYGHCLQLEVPFSWADSGNDRAFFETLFANSLCIVCSILLSSASLYGAGCVIDSAEAFKGSTDVLIGSADMEAFDGPAGLDVESGKLEELIG